MTKEQEFESLPSIVLSHQDDSAGGFGAEWGSAGTDRSTTYPFRGQRSKSERRSAALASGRCRCMAKNGSECCLLPTSGRKETRASRARWSDLRTLSVTQRAVSKVANGPAVMDVPWNVRGCRWSETCQGPCGLSELPGGRLNVCWHLTLRRDLPKTLALARGRSAIPCPSVGGWSPTRKVHFSGFPPNTLSPVCRFHV